MSVIRRGGKSQKRGNMPEVLQYQEENLPNPISILEEYFWEGGVRLVQAAFAHSYFLAPDSVREKVVLFPDRARYSREHYPGLGKGKNAVWSGDGRPVILDDNSRAQMAWAKYSGRPLARGIGYSIRHIWGNPWNPDALRLAGICAICLSGRGC